MKLVRGIGVAFIVLGLAPTTAAAEKSPFFCPSEQDPSHCLVRGGGGDVQVTPKQLQKGDILTVTLSSTSDYGGIADRESQPVIGPVYKGTAPGLKWIDCKGGRLATDPHPDPYMTSIYMTGPRKCRYKVTKSGRGWQKASWHFTVRYGALASYSEDFFKTVGKNVTAIEGFVRGRPRHAGDKEGPGARGVKVVARKKGKTYSAKTDQNGFYSIAINKPGKYEVFPNARPSDLDQKPVPAFHPDEKKVHADEGDIDDVNFKLDRGDSIKVIFRSHGQRTTEAIANGATKLDGVVEVRDLNDDGVPSQDLRLVVNDFKLSPRAALCTAPPVGQPFRLWPGPSGDRIHVGQDPVPANSNGDLKLALYPGTEPGNFIIDVEKKVPGPGDRLKTATVHFRTLPAGDLGTEMGIALADDQHSPTPAHGAQTDPGAANTQNVTWLGPTIAEGKLQGWSFVPLVAGAKYGLLFYRLGSPPSVDANGVPTSGGVFNEGGGAGLQTVASKGEAALQPLADWANGDSVRLNAQSSIAYLGWPLETGPASDCLPQGY